MQMWPAAEPGSCAAGPKLMASGRRQPAEAQSRRAAHNPSWREPLRRRRSDSIVEDMVSISRGRQFLQHVLPAVLRPIRVLFNQVIGLVFMVLAVAALPRGIQIAREFNGDPESFFKLGLTVLFIATMAGYGIYSFWRAHKVSK
jgi:hypothetical protein